MDMKWGTYATTALLLVSVTGLLVFAPVPISADGSTVFDGVGTDITDAFYLEGFDSKGEPISHTITFRYWSDTYCKYVLTIFNLDAKPPNSRPLMRFYQNLEAGDEREFSLYLGTSGGNHRIVMDTHDLVSGNWEVSVTDAKPPVSILDINGDGKTGLEEAIRALKVVSGIQ